MLTSQGVQAQRGSGLTCGAFLARAAPDAVDGNRLLEVGLRGGEAGAEEAQSLAPYQNNLWRNYGTQPDRFKALCVLTDALMLAHADFLVKCSSAVAEFAVYLDHERLGARTLDLQYRCGHRGAARDIGMVRSDGCLREVRPHWGAAL